MYDSGGRGIPLVPWELCPEGVGTAEDLSSQACSRESAAVDTLRKAGHDQVVDERAEPEIPGHRDAWRSSPVSPAKE